MPNQPKNDLSERFIKGVHRGKDIPSLVDKFLDDPDKITANLKKSAALIGQAIHNLNIEAGVDQTTSEGIEAEITEQLETKNATNVKQNAVFIALTCIIYSRASAAYAALNQKSTSAPVKATTTSSPTIPDDARPIAGNDTETDPAKATDATCGESEVDTSEQGFAEFMNGDGTSN